MARFTLTAMCVTIGWEDVEVQLVDGKIGTKISCILNVLQKL